MQHRFLAIRKVLLAAIVLLPLVPMDATTEVVLRSAYRIVLAADSRASYRNNASETECKLFEVGNVYATVSGFAHYGRSSHVIEAIREGFAGNGTFGSHIAGTASALSRKVETELWQLRSRSPSDYQYVVQPTPKPSDFVQLAIAETVRGRPMLGIIELRPDGADHFTARMMLCPGTCRQGTNIFYLGYWERIRPYVASSGQSRSVGSAASIDRLIRLEMAAHPAEVSAPVNILEVNSTGARWLQNGGNCSLPGVGW